LNEKLSFSDIQAKHCQKTVETSQPLYNILPVLISLRKSFLFNLFM
jgi:hypothetical protein